MSCTQVVLRNLPDGWGQNVETGREELAWTLQTLSANSLELSRLWIQSGFSKMLLVDVEKSEFTSLLPILVLLITTAATAPLLLWDVNAFCQVKSPC